MVTAGEEDRAEGGDVVGKEEDHLSRVSFFSFSFFLFLFFFLFFPYSLYSTFSFSLFLSLNYFSIFFIPAKEKIENGKGKEKGAAGEQRRNL